MALKHLTKQGDFLVMRTQEGRIARDDLGRPQATRSMTPGEAALASTTKNGKETWRRKLRALTNNGADLHERLLLIATGNIMHPVGRDPHTGELVRGEPQVPTLETQRAALKDLHEMLHGKAVAETEVNASEQESEKRASLEAMSDEELQRIINAPGNQTVDALPEKGSRE